MTHETDVCVCGYIHARNAWITHSAAYYLREVDHVPEVIPPGGDCGHAERGHVQPRGDARRHVCHGAPADLKGCEGAQGLWDL